MKSVGSQPQRLAPCFLFAAYFFDFVFQHFNDIYVQISGNKVEKQTIAHSVLIIIKSYRSIGYS